MDLTNTNSTKNSTTPLTPQALNANGRLLGSESSKCVSSVYYAGNSSFTWGTEIYLNNVLSVSQRDLVVNINPAERKPGPLDPEWKARTLEYLESVNRQNESMKLPKFPQGAKILYNFSTEIRQGHIDVNNHANYKFYIFGGMICVRTATEKGLLRGFEHLTFDSVVVRDLVCVFEKECLLGEEIRFQLVQSENDGSVFVACLRDETRLAYSRFELHRLSANDAKL